MCIVTTLVMGCGDVKRQTRYRLAAVFNEHVNRACRGVHVKSLTQYRDKMCDTTPCLLLLTVKGFLVTTGQEKCEYESHCRSSRSVRTGT